MVIFSKYQGLGNDFVILDVNKTNLPEPILKGEPHLIKRLCDRRFGIGADGIIINDKPDKQEAHGKMTIFN